MGEMNHIPAQVDAHGVTTPFGRLQGTTTQPGAGVACIRPEAIGLDDGPVRIGPAQVRDAAFFGTHVRAHLIPAAAPDLVLIAHLPPGSMPEPGQSLVLSAKEDAFHIFPKGA
jgi:spermidine/putrescine transport system ATP-binding protein